MKKACIVIPTYNESGNIKNLTEYISKMSKKVKNYEISILVVDDSSPDGTSNIVKKIKNKNVFLLTRKNKEGLGKAYISGFKYAIQNIQPDVLFQMDADFSHNPKEISKFLEQIDKGYNFIIGSRYIKGGKIINWDTKRKLISKFGNLFGRTIAGLKVNDCTSGYRAIKTSLIKKLDLDNMNAKGFAFLMELIYLSQKEKAKIKEIPIIFVDRKYGKSKLRKKDILEFFINCFRLRIKSFL
ncbi:MAG: polyprenol monophosphomannose synthase [Nanoarchaeota archaeon]|nr:polyprenol monophosphomannose synthase [Nanoarchaeota archaeon]